MGIESRATPLRVESLSVIHGQTTEASAGHPHSTLITPGDFCHSHCAPALCTKVPSQECSLFLTGPSPWFPAGQ